MKKKLLIISSLIVMVFVLALGGCSVNEDSYQLVFGNNSHSLTPSIGNAAYQNKWINPEDHEEDEENQNQNGSNTPSDDYVDPTDGLDCSDE